MKVKDMYKIAIVILNYLNDKDTIECVTSIQNMNYPICGIVIVDNCSTNGSFNRLKQRYAKNTNITLLQNKINQGFARGNNLGILYAKKKLKADFILVVNNDTIFTDKNYITSMVKCFRSGVGVIGSKIILNNHIVQPRSIVHLNIKNLLMDYINIFSKRRGSSFDFSIYSGNATEILHGCALMFTPDFLRYYDGFYKKTFLYHEEEILYLMCKCKKLTQVYNPEVSIFHKEDQSSLLSFGNDSEIMNRYAYESKKYVLRWLIKDLIIRMSKSIKCQLMMMFGSKRDLLR